MISRSEILMGREKEFPLTQELENNLARLLISCNIVRKAYGKPLLVSSGYRPGKFNSNAGGAKKSSHMTCEAADFVDKDGSFTKWCLENLLILEESGMYMEDPKFTVGWVHLQIRKTKSGKRIFIP